jgi:hypothetical protein
MSVIVMPGLVPGINVFAMFGIKTWMAGPRPVMTNGKFVVQALS